MFEGFSGLIGGLIMVLLVGTVVSYFLPPLGMLIMGFGIILVVVEFFRLIGLFDILPFILAGAALIVAAVWVIKTIANVRSGKGKPFNLIEDAIIAVGVGVLLLVSVMVMSLSENPMIGIFYIIGEMDFVPGIIAALAIGVAVAAVKAVAEFIIYRVFSKK